MRISAATLLLLPTVTFATSRPRELHRPSSSTSLLPSERRSRLDKPLKPAAALLLSLRGGDGASIVQKAQNIYFGVPLATRSWLSLIIACASLNQVGILPPEALAIDAQATVGRLQLWRPLTAASFMGGLGMQLVQKLYYMVQFGSGLERTLGVGEYLRILASCTAALCIVCNLLGWQFMGDGLIMAITVLTCMQTPDQQMSLYMITIPCSYFPFAQLCMSYLFTQQIPWQDIVGALIGYLHYHINDNAKPDSVFYKDEAELAQLKAATGGGRKVGDSSSGSSSKAAGGGGGAKRKSGGGGGGKKPSARKSKVTTFKDVDCGPGG